MGTIYCSRCPRIYILVPTTHLHDLGILPLRQRAKFDWYVPVLHLPAATGMHVCIMYCHITSWTYTYMHIGNFQYF
jgi:hypothetical protein